MACDCGDCLSCEIHAMRSMRLKRAPVPPPEPEAPRCCEVCGDTLVRRAGERPARWEARVTCSRRCNAKANASGRERVTSGTCALCGDSTDGTAFCSHACASGNKDAVVEHDGFAIVYARTGRPYLTATWSSETAARAELEELLREYPAGSPWRAKIGVAFVRAQEAAA